MQNINVVAVRRLMWQAAGRAMEERDRYREALEAIYENPAAGRAIAAIALADLDDGGDD